MLMFGLVIFDEGLSHAVSRFFASPILDLFASTSRTRDLVCLPDVDEDIHRAAANHSLFAGFFSGQRKVMQRGLARPQRLARLSPHFGFDAAAPDRSRHFAAFQEQQLPAPLLRR